MLAERDVHYGVIARILILERYLFQLHSQLSKPGPRR